MNFTPLLTVSVGLVLVLSAKLTSAATDGISRADLHAFATAETGPAFKLVRHNDSDSDVQRSVVSYEVDGLQQYALVLRPAGEPPAQGWPVIQFNHGFHPNPPRNGFSESGESDRPGDYYRSTVQAFAERGFMVVTPDYRGHNISEGLAYTQRALADSWYTRDAIVCFLAIDSLQGTDSQRHYMLGHSMGGAITLRAALALGDRVRAASVWSTSAGRHLAFMMGKELLSNDGLDSQAVPKPSLDALSAELAQLGEGAAIEDINPISQLGTLQVPMSIQHAAGDKTTPVAASLSLAASLYLAEKPYQLKVHAADEHLFVDTEFAAAVERDIAWFNRFQ